MTKSDNGQNRKAVQAKKERILEAIFSITQTVLERHSHYDVIPEGLAAIGSAIEADRVYYWENSIDEKSGQQLTSQVFEWCSPDISPQIDNNDLRDLPFDIVFDFLEPLKRGEEQIIIVSELEPSYSQKLLAEQEILSLLALPVMVDGEFWGFVGFDDCSKEKKWLKLEISLLNSFVAILSKSIERNLLENNLIKTKHQAEAASRAKSQFLSSISHELRTPLNAIIVYTELLRETNAYAEQSDKIEQIGSSAELLLMLINNLLDYSKLESGKAQLSRGAFSLRDTINNSIKQALAAARGKNTQINCDVDANIPEKLCGDALKINQIMLNLLDNAIKFTPDGEIHIKVQLLEEIGNDLTIGFSIADTGIGMSYEQTENIFEPFKQASPNISASYGGTGLGLAICKNLVELHGGDIWLESEPNQGTTVSFTVLFGKKCQIDRVREPDSKSTMTSAQGKEVDLLIKSLENLNILAVEDNEINRKVLAALFANTQANLEIASSGQEALEKASKKHYDIILMDIIMPETDGYTTTASLRKLPGYAKTPVIAVTAGEIGIEAANCTKHKIDALVAKPLRKQKLFAQINKLMQAQADNTEEISHFNTGEIITGRSSDKLINLLNLADVDYNEALERFDYDWLFYCELLKQFYIDHSVFAAELNRRGIHSLQDYTQKDLLHKIHSLKGSAAEIGAANISQKAADIEKMIKQGSQQELVENDGKSFDEFLQLFQKLIDATSYCCKSSDVFDGK